MQLCLDELCYHGILVTVTKLPHQHPYLLHATSARQWIQCLHYIHHLALHSSRTGEDGTSIYWEEKNHVILKAGPLRLVLKRRVRT